MPVLVSYDTRYFQDTYQAMPKEGYTALFRRMLGHPNIKLLLQTDWKEVEGEVRFDRLVFTGPIDEFFGYLHGALPYRSLSFRMEFHPKPWAQEVGTVNYPNEHPYTRVTEFKHLTGQDYLPHSTLCYEYPEAYEPGGTSPTTGAQGGERGALPEVPGGGETAQGGLFRGKAWGLSLLQHGPGGGPGPEAL